MPQFTFILCDPLESFGSLDDFGNVLRRLKGLGFAGVEFNLTAAGIEQSAKLLEVVRACKLPVVSFLTGANYFQEGLCLSAMDDGVWRKAIERLCRCAAVAAQFGAVLVVGQMQGMLPPTEAASAAAVGRIAEALREVAGAAEKCGANVVVEPVNHLQCGYHHTLEAVMALTGRIGSPNLRPMLDSFHMNIEERSLLEPIRRIGRALGHFHLCESNGSDLGSGHLDIRSMMETLDAVGYEGFVSVKVYRQPWAIAAERTMEYLKANRLVSAD
jgi:sugar phosphate isomerase/epimerase